MADTKQTKILEVVVDNNKAVAAIAEYNRLIDEQRQNQQKLAKDFKDGKISQDDYYKAMSQSKEQTKAYRRQVQELSKEIQNNIKMDTEKANSLRALRAELSNVTKQYDELSEEERRSAQGLELKAKIQDITTQLKNSEQETGRFYRNVGNYADSFVEAFVRMGGSMGNLQGPIGVVKNGFMAISSTPIIAILGALVTIIQKVIQNLKSSEESMNAVTVALAPLNAGSRLLTNVMQKLGEGIVWVAEKLTKLADRLGLINEAMKNEQQLVKDNIALQQRERELVVQNAESSLKISQLRAKAADKLNYTEAERIGYLKEAIAEEESIAKREMEVAQERYRILLEQSKLAANSKEDNDELARARAEALKAEQSYYDKTRELQGQIVEATNAIIAKQKEAAKKEIEELAKATDAKIALMMEGIDKERAAEDARHERALAELRNRLATEANLTQKAKEAINRQIELEEQLHAKKMTELDRSAIEERLAMEQETLKLRLDTAIKGSEDEFSIRQAQLKNEMEAELMNVQLTEEQKLLIKQKYAQLEAQLEDERAQAIIDATRLAYENQIAELALRNQNTLALELEMLQAELDALHQMEGESDAEFMARQLEARQAVADKKKEIADYEVSIEQAKYDAIASLTNGLSGILEAFGKENEAAAKAAKVLALAEIAINTGKAIAAGVAQAQSVPFPANLAAIAATIAAVMGSIASAISTVKSAKFATGGYVSGPGTGTSDSIPARLSNGESVINARSTAMFGPLLSSLNQAGGGVAFNPATGGQREGYEFLAAAVAAGMENVDLHVAVDEVTRVQDRVTRINEISTIE